MARKVPRYEILGSIKWQCDGCGFTRECYQLKDRLTGKLKLACKACMKSFKIKKHPEAENELLCL